jgi:Zn-dependent protease with chaperone function
MPKEVSPSQAAESPLAAFDGIIVPNRAAPVYHAGLTFVAFAMALLPVIYLALIGLIAWGVFYHVTHDVWILELKYGGLLRLIAYVAPAIAGFILVFFMIKPLFAAREHAPDPITLDPEKEPLLFAFVKKISELVGAPTPSRVDVDCQVNASASLRRGIWSRDLVLTIGLPLAAGLDMRQFAGVLAHEFGHFAQGYGMRMTYLIRHINAWFARVVYERDAWDTRLERTAGGAPWPIGIVLQVARGCVWFTRRVLWAFMHVGHAISCFMLRQMEYNADSYEAKLVGGDAFESTATQIRVLSAATQFAYQDVEQCWASRRLPKDLMLLIDHKSTSLPDEVHQRIITANAEAKTGWFDTHPCDSDRLRAVRQLSESGIFHFTEPAARLFADFTALSKTVTRHHYEKHLNLVFTDQALMSMGEFLGERAAFEVADTLTRRYYGAVNTSLHPLLIDRQLPVPIGPAAGLADWRAACEEVEARREEAEKVSAACVEHLERRANLLSAYHLAAAGFHFDPKTYGLSDGPTSPSELRTSAEEALREAETAIEDHLVRLEPFFAALRQRIRLALTIHRDNGAASPAAEESAALVPLVGAIGAEMKGVRDMWAKLSALTALAQNRGNHSDPSRVDDEALRLASDLRRGIIRIKERLGSLTYPFVHPRGHLMIAEYLQAGLAQHEWQRSYESGTAHVNRLFNLHYRLVGRILALADLAEKALDNTPDCPAGSPSEVGAHEGQVASHE